MAIQTVGIITPAIQLKLTFFSPLSLMAHRLNYFFFHFRQSLEVITSLLITA